MTPQNSLDHKGNFRTHPLAELLVEISHARLSGSLRLTDRERKSIIYFNNGAVVFAVSNARTHRLFNTLLKRSLVDQKTLGEISNFANDFELVAALESRKLLTKPQIDSAIVSQIEAIIIDTLTWGDGDWLFSPLARLRADLVFDIDLSAVLTDYARCIPSNLIANRFKSVQEEFSRLNGRSAENLQLHESFTLECFNGHPLTIEQLRTMSAMPESGLLQALYVLWLGGFLARKDWNAAFSEARIRTILSAKMSLVKSVAAPEIAQAPAAPEPDATVSSDPAAPAVPEIEMTLEQYLERMLASETHYEKLGVRSDAAADAIKSAYFGLAKLFHPDRFHRIEPDKLRKIQVAFTELAHAYETLKNPESRETYDYKVRKELEKREMRQAEGLSEMPDTDEQHSEHGLDNFEQGLSFLADEEYAAAAACLARAVHYSPQNALYHAYYGKALSASEKYRHKAESELQAAARLEPKNAKIRLMLVEFFIERNMKKRAEGELTRFLELVPDNREAAELLESVRA